MIKLWRKIKAMIGHVVFKAMGWEYELLPKDVGNKFVMIGFPHNSNMDAVYGICYCFVNRIRTHAFIKKEWMFWPMSWIFKAIGTIAVDRSKSNNLVDAIVKEFSCRSQLRLVVFPEGTRSKVTKIKTGFWYIAKQANVPIVMVFKDSVQKKLKVMGTFMAGESLLEDLKLMQDLYAKVNFTSIDFVGSAR